MSRKAWLIGYDIASPRRLRRVHRLLKRRAFPVQYSLFAAALTAVERDRLLAELGRLIHPRKDDVRFWPLPERVELLRIGPSGPVGFVTAIASPRPLARLVCSRTGVDDG
jgi:CRISPR-associated protein Cas2